MGVLSPILDLPNLTPFLGLAQSGYSSRRDLIKGWLEFYGIPFDKAGEVLVRFTESTDLGFMYLASNTNLEPDRAFHFRSIVSRGPLATHQRNKEHKGPSGGRKRVHSDWQQYDTFQIV